LLLSFGSLIKYENILIGDTYKGEWEFGTYYCSWRITSDRKVLLGSTDSDEIDYLNSRLSELDISEVVKIDNISAFDVEVVTKNGLVIQFFNTTSDDDEVFHMSCPENIYIKFSTERAWETGPYDAPWGT
jgi:hypothetical protein